MKAAKEQTNKFLEVTDPKRALGLWSYRIVRWEHRKQMAAGE